MARFPLAALYLPLVPQSQASAAGWEGKLKTEDRNKPCIVVFHLSKQEAKDLRAQTEHFLATCPVDAETLSYTSEILKQLKNDQFTIKCDWPSFDRLLPAPDKSPPYWPLPSPLWFEPTPAPLSYTAQVG